HNLSPRRYRQISDNAFSHFHGSTAHSSGKSVFRYSPTQVRTGGLKKCRFLAKGNGHGTRFSFRPVFLADDIAMMSGADMGDHCVLVKQHVTVRPHVEKSGIWIMRDGCGRANIRAAVPLMPSGPLKL